MCPIQPPHLKEWCEPREPEVEIRSNISYKKVQKKWTEPLLVHAHASRRLRMDLDVFVREWPYGETGIWQTQCLGTNADFDLDLVLELVKQFLTSALHQMRTILWPSLRKIGRGLRRFRRVRGYARFLEKSLPSVRYLVYKAGKELNDLSRRWEGAMRDLDLQEGDFPVGEGALVPTASPRQLLIRLLLNRPSVFAEIGKDPAAAFANIGEHLTLSSPEIKDKKITLRRPVSDGSPTTFFVCYHHKEIIVGSNSESWGRSSDIGKIRREHRDHRLADYIPLVEGAFEALRETERGINTPSLARTRALAIAEMRGESSGNPNPHFLGRLTETGQAFDRDMKSKQCCYFCKGMMGYWVPAEFAQGDIEHELRRAEWKSKNGHIHACAEVEASLQCSRYWAKKGKDRKY